MKIEDNRESAVVPNLRYLKKFDVLQIGGRKNLYLVVHVEKTKITLSAFAPYFTKLLYINIDSDGTYLDSNVMASYDELNNLKVLNAKLILGD